MIRWLRLMTDQVTIVRLSPDTLQSFLDGYLWIIEEELRTCIGLPPWFDSALSFLVAEIVQDFARHKAPVKCSAQGIRAKARRATEMLEPTLARHHTKNGLVEFNGCQTLEALVGSILQRGRSLYWEPFPLPTPLSPRCEPLEGSD